MSVAQGVLIYSGFQIKIPLSMYTVFWSFPVYSQFPLHRREKYLQELKRPSQSNDFVTNPIDFTQRALPFINLITLSTCCEGPDVPLLLFHPFQGTEHFQEFLQLHSEFVCFSCCSHTVEGSFKWGWQKSMLSLAVGAINSIIQITKLIEMRYGYHYMPLQHLFNC